MHMFEIRGDLFQKADAKSYMAHCISRDCKLGAGIAVDFDKKYNLRRRLKLHPEISSSKCILIDRVFNLITKDLYFEKPTYESMNLSAAELREQIISNNINLISMPRIGSGLDRLNWNLVRVILFEHIGDLDLVINVYYLDSNGG